MRRRSSLRDAGLAHPFENGLNLGQIRRVVAPRRPGVAYAGDEVGWIQRETGLDRGVRLVKSTELREGGGQVQIGRRIISIGLDLPPKPRDRLLPTAEVELRKARRIHPDVRLRIARTEAQRLANVSL